MTAETIAQKLAELERRMEAVETKTSERHQQTFERKPKGAWRELIGWEKDDELFRDAVRLGAEWRAQANAEGR